MLDFTELPISGVMTITPARLEDERGFFSEIYNVERWRELGIEDTFVQDNHSISRDAGVIRGLHFQVSPHPVAKLVRVVRGAVLDVVVDLRHGSPTFGEHATAELSAANWTQIYVPVGVAHGFCTLSKGTEISYKVTDHWFPEVDKGVAWNDPDLAVDWPVDADSAILSKRDRSQPRFAELPEYFVWEG